MGDRTRRMRWMSWRGAGTGAGNAPEDRRLLRRSLRALLLIAPLILGTALLPCGCGGKGSSSHPKKSGTLVPLDRAFQPLRRDFEGDAGKVRLVGVVTPTCGECMESANAIFSRLLTRVPSQDFVVYLIWTSIAGGDVAPRAQRAAEMYLDPRIIHYWDDSGRIGRAFANQMQMEEGRSIYNVFFLYGRRDTWDPEAKMAGEPKGQNALLAGWMPGAPRLRMGENKQIRLPMLDIDILAAGIEELLAEPERGERPDAGK